VGGCLPPTPTSTPLLTRSTNPLGPSLPTQATDPQPHPHPTLTAIRIGMKTLAPGQPPGADPLEGLKRADEGAEPGRPGGRKPSVPSINVATVALEHCLLFDKRYNVIGL
jgi:hypothetical protein